MIRDIQEWMNQHNITVLDRNRRVTVNEPQTEYKFFTDEKNSEYVEQFYDYAYTEPLLTVSIPESNLKQIWSVENHIFNGSSHTQHHHRLFDCIMLQKDQEQKLRSQYTAVQRAYEHYSLLLKLAQSGQLNPTKETNQ